MEVSFCAEDLICFLSFMAQINFYQLCIAETETHRVDNPTPTSETRQEIFRVRVLTGSSIHCQGFIAQSSCTGEKKTSKWRHPHSNEQLNRYNNGRPLGEEVHHGLTDS